MASPVSVEMIEVRVGKKHDVDLGEVADGQRGRGQAFGSECKTGQPDSDPRKQNRIRGVRASRLRGGLGRIKNERRLLDFFADESVAEVFRLAGGRF